jgi:hypothetical protein
MCAVPGASLALRSEEGLTALASATALGHAECEAALRAAGATE